MLCQFASTINDGLEIPLMQHSPKLVCPTKHWLDATPPKPIIMNHLMEKNSPQSRQMVVIHECDLDVTIVVVAHKKIIYLFWKNHNKFKEKRKEKEKRNQPFGVGNMNCI